MCLKSTYLEWRNDNHISHGSTSYNLTHWGRVTHICVSKLTIIGSDNGLSPGRRQAIIWTSAGILLIGTLGTNFSEILGKIHSFSFKQMHFKMSSAKWRLFCLGLNELSRPCLASQYGIPVINYTAQNVMEWTWHYDDSGGYSVSCSLNTHQTPIPRV